MKKNKFLRYLPCLLTCLLALCSFMGCNSIPKLSSGNYYAKGAYQSTFNTPYIYLNTEDSTFMVGLGDIYSYADGGSYEIQQGKIIATSPRATYQFEIKNKNTLILLENGYEEYLQISINTEFIFNDEN